MTLFFVTLAPFVVLFVLLIPMRRPAWQAAPVAYALTVAIALLLWRVTGAVLAASLANAAIVFLEVLLIVVFALMVLNLMIEAGALDEIKAAIGSVTRDDRVLAMLLAWGLVGFIEGIAGFGTPAVIAAPVLVYFGMKPLKAVAICLIGNSTAVPFGAAGTPVVIGFAGLGLGDQTLAQAVLYTAVIHAPLAIFVTCFITWLVTHDRPRGAFREFVPFAAFSALSFSLPYLVFAWLVGPELPAIVGGAVSLAAIALAARHGFLLPAPEKAGDRADGAAEPEPERAGPDARRLLLSVTPFLVMSLALIASRTLPELRDALQSAAIGFGSIGGIELADLTPLYTPYFYLALALLTALLVFPTKPGSLRRAALATYARIRMASIVLVFIIALTQLLLVSGTNQAELPSIPAVLGEGFAELMGGSFVVFSGFLGALGSFMTGSATVSNLLFGSLQADAARALESPAAVFLALQLIGAGVGNMISLSNIAMATGAAGVESNEGEVVRETIVPVIVVCLVAGLALWLW